MTEHLEQKVSEQALVMPGTVTDKISLASRRGVQRPLSQVPQTPWAVTYIPGSSGREEGTKKERKKELASSAFRRETSGGH